MSGSSRLPAWTVISSGIAAKRRKTGVPQTGQKGVDFYVAAVARDLPVRRLAGDRHLGPRGKGPLLLPVLRRLY